MHSEELNQYGLRERDMSYMLDLFRQTPEIRTVLLYGSRANGTYQLGSDVDLAVIGEKIPFGRVHQIHEILEEESPTPLFFDVVHLDNLANEKLKHYIQTEGKQIYPN